MKCFLCSLEFALYDIKTVAIIATSKEKNILLKRVDALQFLVPKYTG